MIRHAKCGGEGKVDLSNQFSISSPSVSFGVDGVSVGVLEISDTKVPLGKLSFTCQDCGKRISDEELEVHCEICRRWHPVKNMHVARNLGCICTNCKDVLSGTKEPTLERQKYCLRFLSITPEMTVVPLVSVLSKPIETV